MGIDKYNISYAVDRIWEKDLFIFVNHKTAPICWSILKEKVGIVDVITYDSHGDFYNGFIAQGPFQELLYRPEDSSFLHQSTSKMMK